MLKEIKLFILVRDQSQQRVNQQGRFSLIFIKGNFRIIFRDQSTPLKGSRKANISSKIQKFEETYKKLIKETLKKKIASKRSLKIYKSQQRITKNPKNLQNIYISMKRRKEQSVNKAKEDNDKFLKDFEMKVNQNYFPKSRNTKHRISSVRFNLTEDNW